MFLADVQYNYHLGPITIALKMESAMSLKCQSKTENMDTSENIMNNSTVHKSFNTFKLKIVIFF